VDESRLPRLRFTDAEEDVTIREMTCPEDVARRISIDEAKGVLDWTSNGKRASFVLADIFRAAEKQQRAIPLDPRFPSQPAFSMVCLRDANPNFVFVRAEWQDNPDLTPMLALGIFDATAGRFTGTAPGGYPHVIDGNRIVVRARDGVTIMGPRGGFAERRATREADISYDGKRLVFVKEEGGDEMFRPVWPYMSDAQGRLKRLTRYLGDIGRASELEPTPEEWPRIGPFEASDCAELGTMPSLNRYCSRPGIRLDGVDYESGSEIACHQMHAADGDGENPVVMCLDPRGPVGVEDPWKGDFVCRVGPHVLPLGACPFLLKEK
jgi:hypothetical protein